MEIMGFIIYALETYILVYYKNCIYYIPNIIYIIGTYSNNYIIILVARVMDEISI